MRQIITDLTELARPASPLQFITKEGFDKDEGLSIIKDIKEIMEADRSIISLSAPQIGIDARIFCIRFQDAIKTFVNPVVTKKSNFVVRPETFIGMPGKEILIIRPEELTVVYYTDEFKYEENKLLGAAARVFDQSAQLLDGVLPDELGLISDVEEDGSLSALTDEEIAEVTEIYKKFIEAKMAAAHKEIDGNADLEKQYKSLLFAENVINGRASVIGKSPSKQAEATAAFSIKKADQAQSHAQRAQLLNLSRKSGKRRRGK